MNNQIYGTLASLLLQIGRNNEADRLLSLTNVWDEDEPAAGPWFRVNSRILRLKTDAAKREGKFTRALALSIEQFMLDEISNPERDETVTTERGGVGGIIELLERSGRGDLAQAVLPFAYHEAKRDIARDEEEPLRLPLDLHLFERASGPTGRSPVISDALGELGRMYSRMGRHSEALPLLELQQHIRANIFGETNPKVSETSARVADEHRALGHFSRSLEIAREAYSAAVAYVDLRGERFETAASTADLLSRPGLSMLESLHAQGEANPSLDASLAEEAFEVVQRLESSAVAVGLRAFETRLGQVDRASAEFLRRRQDLEQRLRQLDANLVAAASAAPIDTARMQELRSEITGTEKEVEQLKLKRPKRLEETDPISERTVRFADLQPVLRDDEVVIFILPTERETFIFIATKDNLTWRSVDVNDNFISEKVATLRCGIDEAQWTKLGGGKQCYRLTGSIIHNSELPFRIDVAYELYDRLFGPIAGIIANKKLMLVVSGALVTIPPHLLVTSDASVQIAPSPDLYRTVAWLGRQHAITMLPSAASLVGMRRLAHTRIPAPLSYLGLGTPKLDGHEGCKFEAVASSCPGTEADLRAMSGLSGVDIEHIEARRGILGVGSVRDICPLPDSALELQCVARSVGAADKDLMIGGMLTAASVKAAPLDQYRILHFATHGLLPEETAVFLPEVNEPALVLTPPTSPRSGDTGLLTASEITELRLNADLVVLSACNTAGGDRPGSEALSGLARAFFTLAHGRCWFRIGTCHQLQQRG